jgi:hypothetical protein
MSYNFGETDEEAMKSAYAAGFDAFRSTKPRHLIADDIDPVESEMALHEYPEVRVAINESQSAKKFWWALEDYLEEECSEERHQAFQRAAAEEEDFWTCFEAGAYASLKNEEYNPEDDLSLFFDQ